MSDNPKFPWNKKKKEPAPFEAVYAGPDFFNSQPPTFQCVYAGPEYFNPSQTPAGAYGPPPAEPAKPTQDDPNAQYCPNCGNKVFQGARFCSECGTVLPQNE